MNGTSNWTILEAVQWTTGHFERSGALTPRLDAEVLLASVLGMERIQLYVEHARPLDPGERERYRALVRRRASGEPVQYLTGRQEFWSLALRVEPGVLIPRPETEVLVEEAIREARRQAALPEAALRIADVGTGSGCVAIAIARELPEARVLAGDVEEVPLRIAAENAKACGVAERVEVIGADGLLGLWEAAGREPFHVVASNPPYIGEDEVPGLMREVRDHEPRAALVAGEGGLAALRRLVREAAEPGVLVPGGALVVETGGPRQTPVVQKLMEDSGFSEVRIRDDYAGLPRVVSGAVRLG